MRNAIQPKLSQAKVAKFFNIAPASVAQWESGRSRPDVDKLPALASLYGVSLPELCGDDLPVPLIASTPLQDRQQAEQFLQQQLLVLSASWRILSAEERDSILTLATSLANRRKSA